jgi:hypothetical protein
MVYTGGLRRSFQIPYEGAEKWGTGINPIHEEYGSDALRLEPLPERRGETAQPRGSVPEQLIATNLWGYTPEDSTYATGVDYDGRPSWNEQPAEYRGDSDDHPPYNASGGVRENFRAMHDGAHRFRQKLADALPSETVTEGWRNKPKGSPADSEPSDPSQYEMQTSMTQRYKTRDNSHAVARMTDAARATIDSRVTGQKLKIYSGEQRHYDMMPREQTPILRGFSYRTAGTGPVRYLRPNEYVPVMPVQRVPPPDPYEGDPETELTSGYGYTPEDVYYA